MELFSKGVPRNGTCPAPFFFLHFSDGTTFFLLCRRVLQVGDELVPLLLLLESGEDHLGAGDVLLGVDEVLVQRVRAPGDA